MRLSIITINLNDAEGLERTLKSVWKNQSFSDFEHIIIDGGSTDGSVDVIKKYADKLSYWISEPDNGIYNAMNKGILQAKGDYLLFLNSGDCLTDDILNKICFELKGEDIIYGYISEVNSKGKLIGIKSENLNIIEKIFVSSLPHPATFIKKTLFEDCSYNENYKIISDWIFFLEQVVIKGCSTRYIDFNISVFNSYGISSQAGALEKIKRERYVYLNSRFGDVAANIITQLTISVQERVNIEVLLKKAQRSLLNNKIKSLFKKYK